MLPWLAGALLIAGIIVFAIRYFPNDSGVAPSTAGPPVRSVDQRTVPLDPSITRLARTFLHAAVGGANATLAYRISGPEIRQGMTLAQWKRDWADPNVGVPIIPFPVDKVQASPFRVDLSYKRDALLEVALIPKKGSELKSQVFFIGFQKHGNRWLVNYWGAHSPYGVHDAR